MEQPGITAAVCCILKDTNGQARLAAYCEPSISPASVDRAALHASLAKRLPTYMVPEVLVVLQSLPRLSNEKLNRKALPEPDWAADAFGAAAAGCGGVGGSSASSSGPKFTARQLAADRVLDAVVASWARALGVEQFTLGPKSDFMGLGGNSLQAGLMAAAVRKALQLPRLSGLLIYTHSQLGSYVSEVRQQAKAAGADAADQQGFTISAVSGLKSFGDAASAGSDSDPTCAADVSSGSLRSVSGSRGTCSGSKHAPMPLWFASLLQLLAAGLISGLQLIVSLAPLLTVQIVMAHLNEWTALAFIPLAKIILLLSEWL